MTPGNMVLVDIYQDATERPFTYLFINLTQECDAEVKYLSNLFDGTIYIYMLMLGEVLKRWLLMDLSIALDYHKKVWRKI